MGRGGGRTIHALAATSTEKVYGIDYSDESVAVSRRTNRKWISEGRTIRQSQGRACPTAPSISAIDETLYYWPDLGGRCRALRVLAGGRRVIAEVYKKEGSLRRLEWP
jgi:hypothetical protein